MAHDAIRVGIIGAGTNTVDMHIPKLQELDGVEIVSVCNRSRESGQKVADQFGIPQVCEQWTEIIDDEDIDAIVIGTWPYMHCLLTCAALENDKHVLCEARMAMNADEAHEMLDTANQYPHLTAQIVPGPHTLAYDQTIQELIADGYLGDIYAIDVRGIGKAFVDKTAPRTWRQDFDLSGYNTMAMGICYEVLSRWVGHATEVMAMGKVFVPQRQHQDGSGIATVRVPDHLDILARMECGAQARMQFSGVTGLAEDTFSTTIYGSEGTLKLDSVAEKLYGGRTGDKALAEIAIEPAKRGGWRVEAEFINAIRGEEKIRYTNFSDAVKYMEFTEAVALSQAAGDTIVLPL
jgi:predicted dehydrogenase